MDPVKPLKIDSFFSEIFFVFARSLGGRGPECAGVGASQLIWTGLQGTVTRRPFLGLQCKDSCFFKLLYLLCYFEFSLLSTPDNSLQENKTRNLKKLHNPFRIFRIGPVVNFRDGRSHKILLYLCDLKS